MNYNATIAVLLTCHNRREKTLDCLSQLFRASLPVGFIIKVYLVDDGSTDGTSEAVNKYFPQVTIIQGNGHLYWNKGMNLAWSHAAKSDFDYYLWLNDDTIIEENAIITLLKISNSKENQSIICGTCKSVQNGKITYGGYNLASRGQNINSGNIEKCDYFNGNLVLVPKAVYIQVGNLDPVFVHSLGDYDYGLRAKKLNISSWVTGEAIAICERNNLPNWANPKNSLKHRLNAFYTPLGAAPFTYFIYANRHFGLLKAIKTFIAQHIRVLLPRFWV